MNFPKKYYLLKNEPDLKQDIRKSQELQCIAQVGMKKKKKFFEKCAILTLILDILSFLIVATSLFHK